MKTARLLLLLIVCSTAALTQAETVVPHTFEDGTPAEASEVNENFDALAESIDEAAVGRLVVKSAGEVLGFALLSGFISRQGYYVNIIDVETGKIKNTNLAYTNSNCSGSAYAAYGAGAGRVFSVGPAGLSSYWAIPLDATLQVVTVGSVIDSYSGDCSTITPEIQTLPNAVPNDPAVTGIQNKGARGGEEYAWPITFEVL